MNDFSVLSWKMMDELFDGIIIGVHWAKWKRYWYIFLPCDAIILTLKHGKFMLPVDWLFQKEFSLSLDTVDNTE